MVLYANDIVMLIITLFSLALFLFAVSFQIFRKNSVGKDVECVLLKKEYTNLIMSALFLFMGIVDIIQYLNSWRKLLTILLAGINFILVGSSFAAIFFSQKIYIGSKGIAFFRFPFIIKREEIESFFWEHGNKLIIAKRDSRRYKLVIADDQKQSADDLLRSKIRSAEFILEHQR